MLVSQITQVCAPARLLTNPITLITNLYPIQGCPIGHQNPSLTCGIGESSWEVKGWWGQGFTHQLTHEYMMEDMVLPTS